MIAYCHIRKTATLIAMMPYTMYVGFVRFRRALSFCQRVCFGGGRRGSRKYVGRMGGAAEVERFLGRKLRLRLRASEELNGRGRRARVRVGAMEMDIDCGMEREIAAAERDRAPTPPRGALLHARAARPSPVTSLDMVG